MAARSSRRSFGARALLAIALLLGFYVLGLAVIAACAGGVWLQVAAGHLYLKLILVLVVVGGSVAWGLVRSLVAFGDGFEPPGPEITRKDEPALFEVIDQVADAMHTRLPEHVYLFPDVNAFVAEVGGFLGFGTRRVMGIGVGLLQVDTVQQLKATLAHEFGHYEGGDTRLGGFLYRTRSGLARVIQNLGGGLTGGLFVWYFKMFLRITHGMSRAQELAADEASVRVAGTAAHIEGLRREAHGGVMFSTFLQTEVSPLVNEGYRPVDLFKGFRLARKEMHRSGARKDLDELLAKAETDPYDTHPAFPERIAYAESLPIVTCESDDRPAREILADAEAVERRLGVLFLAKATDDKPLQSVTWRDSGPKVFGPKLERDAESFVAALKKAGFAVETPLEAAREATEALYEDDCVPWVKRVAPNLERAPSRDAAERFVAQVAGVCLATALVRRGGEWRSSPGRPVEVVEGETVHDPFTWAREAMADDDARDALTERIENLSTSSAPAVDAG